MLVKKILLLVLVISFSGVYAQKQKATVYYKNEKVLHGYVKVRSNNYFNANVELNWSSAKNGVFSKLNNDEIERVAIKNQNYFVKQIEVGTNKPQKLLREELKGKVSIYSLGNYKFIESKKHGLKMISKVYEGDDSPLSIMNKGILSVYVNDCEAAHDAAYQSIGGMSYLQMKKIVEQYNNCDSYAGSHKNASKAAFKDTISDRSKFKIGVGAAQFTTDLSNHKKLRGYDLDKISSLAYNINATFI